MMTHASSGLMIDDAHRLLLPEPDGRSHLELSFIFEHSFIYLFTAAVMVIFVNNGKTCFSFHLSFLILIGADQRRCDSGGAQAAAARLNRS